MRNLQKILALVLALVMSLSLMATAGAREFTDGDQIDETFAESVDVLTGLEVFQGYPTGDFQPKGDITRAEVAAIIYRIATGDVTDSQVGIYADYNKFSDVPSDNWAAGYINYCANAEYIKGRGDGKFYPQDKVTGYEALAMILRVVGYDKNGEFTGADWQVQTAATANQRKVTKNVNAGTLGNPASRETVAELLCQAILIEKVNYTLAFGYQISTNPEDTIAYETFKMERLTGVVTGNEIADLKETSPMAAGQTRMVIDGNERTLNVTSGLEDIGKSVRVYVRPQSGTTRYDMVTADVYATELNKVYDSFASVSSVGNSTASAEGITSIAGAEHYINYDYVTRWTARMRITYVMDLKWTEYQAFAMRKDNGGKLYPYNANANMANPGAEVAIPDNRSDWDTRLPHDDYTFTYVKTIALDEELTQQDWDNLKAIFTDADKIAANNWLMGEVYVGTATFTATEDISDDIRWEDFVATYLKNEETRQQVESNGLGNRLIIIDNDNDGIAEYVLQTIYTIGKVVPNGSNKTLSAVESKFSHTSDKVNIVNQSDDLVSVSGKELANSEDELAVDDVVIYAKIDGNLRAQKAETETARITAINRATTTVTYEGGEKKQSAVHPHADGLSSGVANMVIGTNYTMYFDLDGNLAAFVEGNVGSFVLLTDGWYNQAVNAREYAVQAYVDGRLQTVNVTNNGSLFVNNTVQNNNNSWGRLHTGFGSSTINSGNTNGNNVQTIVANIEDGNLIPVDKSYRVSQRVDMLDMVNNAIPTRDGSARGNVYTTTYGLNNIAYNDAVDNNGGAGYEVLGRSDTVYYYVHNIGKTVNGQNNYVVRTYTGYSNIPSIDPSYIEDVYTVGIRAGATTSTDTNARYYTAEVVVVELNEKYLDSRVTSEQVFIPSTGFVSGNIQGVGLEQVEMIRGNGAVETVWVDMRQSDRRGYDVTDSSSGTTTSYAGMYFMDPIGTTTDGEVTYKIEPMENYHIRANNYLVGYVSQTNVTNDHVRVDMQVPGIVNGFPCPVDATNVNNIVARQGATITANSKLYKLGYNGSGVPTLNGGLTAAEVFYRNPDPNVTSTDRVETNELWDRSSNPALFNLNPRNEVLVRYDDSGNVIWAISFREFRSVNSANIGTRDSFAQSAWWNALPAAQDNVTTSTKFLGKSTLDADSGAGTAASPYKITMSHEDALKAQAANNIIDVTADIGTVVTYKLEKWNGTTNWVEIPRNDINAQKPANTTDEQRYQLTITLNQGEPRVYILVKEAAKTGAKLVSTPASNIDAANKLIMLPKSGFPTIAAYLGQFRATENGYIVWNVTLDGNVKTWDSRNAVPNDFNIRNTDDIQYITATVYNEGETVSTGEFYQGGMNAKQAIADAAKKAAEKLLTDAGVANTGTVATKLTAVKSAIDTWLTSNPGATEAQLQAYLNSTAYKTLVTDLKAAIAAAQATTLKIGAGIGTSNNGFPTAVLSDNRVLSGTAINVESNVTVNVTSKAGLQAGGVFIFTATRTSDGAKIPGGEVTVDGTAKTYTINLNGLTAGEWTLSVVKKQTAPVQVSWTPNDSNITYNGNAASTIAVTPGETVTFTVKANSGKYITGVTTNDIATTSPTTTATAPVLTEATYTYVVPINQTGAVTITVNTDDLVTPDKAGGSATEVAKMTSAGIGVPVFNKTNHVVTIPVTNETTFQNALKNPDGSVMTPDQARAADYSVPPVGTGAENQLTYAITFELPTGTARVEYQNKNGDWVNWTDGLNLDDMEMTEWATVAKWNGTSWVLNTDGTRFNFKFLSADGKEIGTQAWDVSVG